MARRERAPEYGTPQVPQGIIGSVQPPGGRTRRFSMLDTSPLSSALLNMQEESNRRLKEQLEPVLFQAGQQEERRRRASAQADPDVPDVPTLRGPNRRLLALDSAYQAMYDAGRGYAFAAHAVESHAKILEQKRTAPRRTETQGRFGEALPFDSDVPEDADGFLYDPDGFSEFSRELERQTLDQISRVDPSGRALELVKDSLTRVHTDQREKAEVEYSTYQRLKGKEALDRALAEHRRHTDHVVRNAIATRGVGGALAYVMSDEFRGYLDKSRDELYETNPAMDVYYPGQGKQRAERFNDETYNEAVAGIVAHSKTIMGSQTATVAQKMAAARTLQATARWLNTDAGNRYFDKEQLAIAVGAVDDGIRAALNEWNKETDNLVAGLSAPGGAGATGADRQGFGITIEGQLGKADALVPGWQQAHTIPQNWTAEQLRIAQRAGVQAYVARGVQYAAALDEKGRPVDLDLKRVIPGYRTILERYERFDDLAGITEEIEQGIPLERLLASPDLHPALRARMEKLQAEGQTHYRPPLYQDKEFREALSRRITDDLLTIDRDPGRIVEMSNATGIPPLATVLAEPDDVQTTAARVGENVRKRTRTAGEMTTNVFGRPRVSLDRDSAKALAGVIAAAQAAPFEPGAGGQPRIDEAWAITSQALRGYSEGARAALGESARPTYFWADPQPFAQIARQEGVSQETVSGMQLGMMVAEVRPDYGRAIFEGALTFAGMQSSMSAKDRDTVAAWRYSNRSKLDALAGMFAGGAANRAGAVKGIGDALAGFAWMQVRSGKSPDLDAALKEVQQIVDQRTVSVPMEALNADVQPVVLHPNFTAVPEHRRALEAALPVVMSHTALTGLFGQANYASQLANAAPVMTEIDGRMYIGFYKGGYPVQVNREELFIDVTELALLPAREGTVTSVMVGTRWVQNTDPMWRGFLRTRPAGSTGVPQAR